MTSVTRARTLSEMEAYLQSDWDLHQVVVTGPNITDREFWMTKETPITDQTEAIGQTSGAIKADSYARGYSVEQMLKIFHLEHNIRERGAVHQTISADSTGWRVQWFMPNGEAVCCCSGYRTHPQEIDARLGAAECVMEMFNAVSQTISDTDYSGNRRS